MTLRRLLGPLAVVLALGSACGGLAPEDGDAATGGTGSAEGTGGLGASSGGMDCDGRDLLLLTETLEGGAGGMTGAPVHMVSEEKSGLVQCSAGRINRAEALDCGPPLTFDRHVFCDENWPEYGEFCLPPEWDESCADGTCLVTTGCRTDEECASDEVCVCASEAQSVSRCVLAGCRTNDDCESGECGARTHTCRSEVDAFACRTDQDECRNDEDCGDGPDQCDYDTKSALWRCTEYSDCE